MVFHGDFTMVEPVKSRRKKNKHKSLFYVYTAILTPETKRCKL